MTETLENMGENTEIPASKEKKTRKKRISRAQKRMHSGGTQDKMGVLGRDPNFIYRWANADNVREYERYGYEVDTDKNIEIISDNSQKPGEAKELLTNKKDGGTSILMKQRKDFYEEDQALKAKKIDEAEAGMYKQMTEEEGRYGAL